MHWPSIALALPKKFDVFNCSNQAKFPTWLIIVLLLLDYGSWVSLTINNPLSLEIPLKSKDKLQQMKKTYWMIVMSIFYSRLGIRISFMVGILSVDWISRIRRLNVSIFTKESGSSLAQVSRCHSTCGFLETCQERFEIWSKKFYIGMQVVLLSSTCGIETLTRSLKEVFLYFVRTHLIDKLFVLILLK